MTDYTEQEVRKMARFAHVDGMPETVTEKMLTQLADMLAEREKTEPVVYVSHDDLHNQNFVGINAVKVGHEDLMKHYTLPLYTHPAAQPRVPDVVISACRYVVNEATLTDLLNGGFSHLQQDELEDWLAAQESGR